MKKIIILFQLWLASIAVLSAQETPCTATTLTLQNCAISSPSYTQVYVGSNSSISSTVSTCNDNDNDSWVKIVVPAGVEGVAIVTNNYGGCSGICLTDITGEWYAEGASCSALTQFGSCFDLSTSGSAGVVVARLYGIPTSGGTYYIRITEDDNQGGWVKLAAVRNSGDIQSAPIPLATATGDYCNYWANGGDCSAVNTNGSSTTCIGTVDNTIFYSFTVTASTPQPITFSLDNISCAGTMQMAVVKADCSGGTYASLCGITSSAQTLTAPTLANGNYLFVVDGTAGDKCSWQINSSLTCEISALTATPTSGSCNDNGTPADLTDDYYLANISVTFSGRPATGTLNLSGAALHSTNTVSSVNVGSTTTTTTHTFTGVRLKANGVANALTASFSAVSSTCTFTITPAAVTAVPSTATISGTTTVCSPATTTLSVVSDVGYTYTWAATSGGTISGSTTGASIVATTSGTYNVTISNAVGCKVSGSQAVTVNLISSPVVSGPTAICGGASVTLDAGAGYSGYTWAATGGGTIVGATNTRTISASTQGTYNVTVTGAGGCTATGTKVISTSVANPSTPTITGASSVCTGASATIDAGPGYTTYSWTASGGGATSGSTTAQSLVAVGAGTYTIMVSNTGGCTATASKVITAQSAVNVCENGTFTVAQTGANTSGSYRVTYFVVSSGTVKGKNTTGIFDLTAMGLTAAANANTCLVYTVNDDGTATLPSVNAAYSITGSCYTQSSACITINPTPTATISGLATICSGTPTTLTASTNASYNWAASSGGTISGSTTGASIQATTAGNYTVTVTSAAGCKAVSTPKVVSTFANPTTPTIVGQSALCSAGTTTLDAGLGYTTYLWSNANTTQSSVVTGPGTYTVTVSNTAQCTATASKVISSDTPIDVCENGSINSSSTGNYTGSGYRTTYFVVADGIVVAQNTTGTFNLTTIGLTAVSNANNAFVYVVNDNGSATLPANGAAYSVSGSCVSQSSRCLTVNAPTPAAISGPTSFCSGGSATLSSTAGFSNYAWATTGGSISGATNGSSVVVTAAGSYQVTATDAKGCKSVKSQNVIEINAAGNVVLASSPTNAVPLTPTCTFSGWTYYANPNNQEELYFAINWAPDGSLSAANTAAKSAAQVTLNVGSSATTWAPTSAVYLNGDPATQYATAAMKRFWNVNTMGNSIDESVKIRFYYDQAEMDAANDAIAAWASANGAGVETPIWFKTVSSGANNPFDPSTDINTQAIESNSMVLTPASTGFENNVKYVQFDGITSFSGGGFSAGASPPSILPIELLSFTGRTIEKTNHLQWKTATEENSDHFEIQKSKDAVEFTVIGNVQAAGNSSTEMNYTFKDFNPFTGNNYYRLKMIDTDGSFKYSNIINLPLFNDELTVLNIYPNPTKERLYMDVYTPENEVINVSIIDAVGRHLGTQKIELSRGSNTRQIEIQDLPSGFYFLSFTCCGNTQQQFKFIKE